MYKHTMTLIRVTTAFLLNRCGEQPRSDVSLLGVIQGQRKHFQTKYSGGIIHFSRGCKAGDYPCMEDL